MLAFFGVPLSKLLFSPCFICSLLFMLFSFRYADKKHGKLLSCSLYVVGLHLDCTKLFRFYIDVLKMAC